MELRLMIDETELGLIKFIAGQYWYFANKENIQKALVEHPVEMKFYDLPTEGMVSSKDAFEILHEFKHALSRNDLNKLAGIKESDSEFVKLHKLAGLDFTFNQVFSIKQKA